MRLITPHVKIKTYKAHYRTNGYMRVVDRDQIFGLKTRFKTRF